MAEVDGQEKTEQPTSKKLQEARDKGQVAKSMEINSFAIFTSGLLLVLISQSHLGTQMSEMSIKIFNSLDVLELNANMIQGYAAQALAFFVITIGPVFAGIFVVALIAGISQVGFKISVKALKPKFNKLNPINGIKSLFFSSRSFVEFGKALAKLTVIGLFTYLVLYDFVINSPSLTDLTVSEIVSYLLDAAYSFLWKVALVFAAIAAIDFLYQRKKFNKDMMMTKQEVKEEFKQSEGDPLIKSRIKKLQYEAAKKRMMQNIPKADVIITNPTHYAIALKYDMQKDKAPRVLAKGVDELAQRIKKIAAENDIPMHEDRELARMLYKMCDIGDLIPTVLFKAVAQILAYVYQLKNEKKKRSIV
ncbi:MAG: flagellar biosynthesis protein FlhB [Ignavibacteriales bacterium]|nr:MAG: flagellar biosynthesis protein FlhB [Ignavibacteriales bacterium]